MKPLFALATLAFLSTLTASASTIVTDKGHCSYFHNGHKVFDQVCSISGGTLSVEGPVMYEVTFTRASSIRVEISIKNPSFGTVNGLPATVEDLGSEWKLTVWGNEQETDQEVYRFKKIEL